MKNFVLHLHFVPGQLLIFFLLNISSSLAYVWKCTMLWELRYVSEWFTGDIFFQKAEYLDMSLGDMHKEWYLIFFPLFFSEIYLNIFFLRM